MDEVSIMTSFEGGEEGGVSRPRTGTGPGLQMGKCLLGTAAGVPREDVFSRGGGVGGRLGIGCTRATMAAMIAIAGDGQAERCSQVGHDIGNGVAGCETSRQGGVTARGAASNK